MTEMEQTKRTKLNKRNHRNDKNETNPTTTLKRPKRPQRNDRNYQSNIQLEGCNISALFYLGRGSIFSETKSISCILNESSRKHKNISMKNYHVQRIQLTLYTVELNP